MDNWDLVALDFVVFIKFKLRNNFDDFLLPVWVFICIKYSTILNFVKLLLLLTLLLFTSNSCFFIRQVAVGLQILKVFKLFSHFRVEGFSLVRPSLVYQILVRFLLQVTALQQNRSHMFLPAILCEVGANGVNENQLSLDEF